MHEASMTGLIKTLAILFIIYYSFKIIARYVLPIFIRRTINKMEDKFKAQQESQQPQGKVGETTIEKAPRTTSKRKNDRGEYIDFEEVD